jgi:polyhydroxyalkanoate synthesis regulator phasin
VGRTRVRAEVGELSDDARERLVDGLLDQLSADREQLPEELRERLLDGMVDELIAGKRGEAEILGSGGVLGELTRRLVERALSESSQSIWAIPRATPRRAARATRATVARPRRC